MWKIKYVMGQDKLSQNIILLHACMHAYITHEQFTTPLLNNFLVNRCLTHTD